jgi:very-short-patch-repair endonuclease
MSPIRRKVSPHAKRLRRERTDAEDKFWQAVRDRQLDGFKFRFQHSVYPRVADFACLDAMLIVEIDGGQHGDAQDDERTAFLQSKGFEVLRFWNNEVLANLEGVMSVVHAALLRRTRHLR